TSQGGQDIAVCSIDTDRDHGDALLAVMVAGLGAELLDSGVSFDDELCPPLEEGSVDHGTEGACTGHSGAAKDGFRAPR
ncbi:hypothetical protein, partial [Agrococcus casei]|uniref:hypothetical protein n=1 Tax=Agrococcus casei TaxID=343512 RepID=UPI003F8F0C51